MRTILAVIMTLWTVHTLYGQKIVGEVRLPEIRESGIYRIEMPPEITRYFTRDFSNLRVADSSGNYVPFIVDEDVERRSEQFVRYLMDVREENGCCTTVTLENKDLDSINNIHLRIRNADVVKTASLSASDDGGRWYVLKDRFAIRAIDNPASTSELRILDFPLSKYRYYRLVVDDSLNAPLNIIEAGYYRAQVSAGSFYPLSNVNAAQTENRPARTSTVTIRLDTTHYVDRLVVSASGYPYFNRSSTLYKITQVKDRRGKSTRHRIPLLTFQLTNEGSAELHIPGVTASEFEIEIQNYDSPPLKVATPTLIQRKRYVTAYFTAGSYRLMIGEETMDRPVYDLAMFKPQFQTRAFVLQPAEATIFPVSLEASKDFFSKEIMWGAIVGIILILGVITYRMMQDIKRA